MRRTNVYLDEAQTAALDDVAKGQGISRAELIRRLLDRGIQNGPVDRSADLAAIDESFGILADHEFPPRAPDERAAHLDRVGRS